MKIKFLNIYKWIILLLFFNSMYPWYIWNNQLGYISTAIGGFASIIMMSKCEIKKEFNKNLGLLIALLILTGYMCIKSNINGILSWICQLCIWLGILGMDLRSKERILQFITKWFSIFLVISAIFYLLWLFNIYSITPTRIEFEEGRYTSDNYYLFTNGLIDFRLTDFYRFKSIFMEPGHMTMGIVPLIVLNRFNLRNIYVCFLLLTELLSFSLAGIISMTVSYILLNINRNMFRNIGIGIVVVIGVIIGINQAGYGEVLDVYLWNRIEITDDGEIAGYNRTSHNLDKLFDRVISSSDCIFGIQGFDGDLGDGGNAGYKVYIIQNGIIGIMIIIYIYLYYLYKYRTYGIFVITLLFTMLLYQNTYPTWICVLGTYMLGCPTFYNRLKASNSTSKSNYT